MDKNAPKALLQTLGQTTPKKTSDNADEEDDDLSGDDDESDDEDMPNDVCVTVMMITTLW